jgi:hypothetical protein
MKESVLRDLVAGSMVKLVSGGLQGIYPDKFAGKAFKAEGQYVVQSPVVLSQLAVSPAAQVLSLLVMVRAGRRICPGTPKEEALKLVLSANAEVLNFTSSRLSWLLAKVEGIAGAEITPPKVTNFTGVQAFRVRADEGVFFEFLCPAHNLAFRLAVVVQCL